MIAENNQKYEKKFLGVIDQTTALAFTRTRFAADRTLLSWIRTSFSMITFGFAIAKFFQFLKTLENYPKQNISTKHLGAFLIILGVASLIPAIMEYRKELKAISAIDKGPRWSYALIFAFLVGLIGLYALIDALVVRLF